MESLFKLAHDDFQGMYKTKYTHGMSVICSLMFLSDYNNI